MSAKTKRIAVLLGFKTAVVVSSTLDALSCRATKIAHYGERTREGVAASRAELLPGPIHAGARESWSFDHVRRAATCRPPRIGYSDTTLDARATIPAFDAYLAESGLKLRATVIGGAALQLMGVIARPTKDCDVLDPALSARIIEAADGFAFSVGRRA